ncbi:MAG TPA: hypothetical protein VFS40_01915 [Gemmatimonadales bacterium]|nr:hypothetical protein [Gemmatimonadales bacterium]
MAEENAAQLPEPAAAPEPKPQAGVTAGGRGHLVVVTTRAVGAADAAPPGAVLVTRFWHPRDRRWSENAFESLEHALRLFVDESGWTLLQQQALAAPHAHELVFQARREDFQRPSTEELLREVGLDPGAVAEFLDHPDPSSPSGSAEPPPSPTL